MFARESIFASNLAPPVRVVLSSPARDARGHSSIETEWLRRARYERRPTRVSTTRQRSQEQSRQFPTPHSFLSLSLTVSPTPSLPAVANAAAAPTAEGPSAADVHALLDVDGDGCVTEAELRAAAEDRGIVLTEEQVQAFMALEADGDCVSLEAFLNSLDGSVEGYIDDLKRLEFCQKEYGTVGYCPTLF